MKKNIIMCLIILLVTVLLFSIGTYAYYSVVFQDERTNENKGNTNLKTCSIAKATTITDIPDSIGSFSESNIYPGHKEVTSFKVTASGTIGSTSSFQINYEVFENGLGYGNVKVSVYKSYEEIKVTNNYFECEKKSENVESVTRYYETCKEKELGSLIEETILTGGSEEITIGNDTLIVKETEKVAYYYVVIEFLNKEENQNEFMNTKLNGKIKVVPTTEKTVHKYKESILNGMDPILKDELIPVIIEEDGVVRKADEGSEWYRYEEKEWANAIILKNESEEYCPYEIIPEEAIESYFVWIPKYRYQLWDLGNYTTTTEIDESKVHIIPLIFGDYNTRDIEGECKTPMESGATGQCKVGDYMTHPAFLSIPSTGFWVGKFETSKSNDVEDNNINPSGVQIKPNEISWRNIQVANAFYTTYDYKRNLDSHMMKNTEWGAVAYLQHSEYGSHESVRINNNSDYKTGYASIKEPTCYWVAESQDCNQYGTTSDVTLSYNTETGYLASTTKNISGIYDMSGGAWEFVMGIMVDDSGNLLSGTNSEFNSGFIGNYGEGGKLEFGYSFPNSKYYDKYANNTSASEYTRRVLGDATGEMGPFIYINNDGHISSWYRDEATYVIHDRPWFMRGAQRTHGLKAGIMNFGIANGAVNSGYGFRLILTPQN